MASSCILASSHFFALVMRTPAPIPSAMVPKMTSPNRTSMMCSLSPAVGVLLVLVFLDEFDGVDDASHVVALNHQ